VSLAWSQISFEAPSSLHPRASWSSHNFAGIKVFAEDALAKSFGLQYLNRSIQKKKEIDQLKVKLEGEKKRKEPGAKFTDQKIQSVMGELAGNMGRAAAPAISPCAIATIESTNVLTTAAIFLILFRQLDGEQGSPPVGVFERKFEFERPAHQIFTSRVLRERRRRGEKVA
jgi:hypothetical protein